MGLEEKMAFCISQETLPTEGYCSDNRCAGIGCAVLGCSRFAYLVELIVD